MLPLILFVSTLAGIIVSIAALPREVRANQQSNISFQMLTLASKYLSSHLTCMALTWLLQSRRSIPSDAPPLVGGDRGRVVFDPFIDSRVVRAIPISVF